MSKEQPAFIDEVFDSESEEEEIDVDETEEEVTE